MMKNKFYAICLIIVSIIPIIIDKDGTVSVFLWILAIGIWFDKNDWILHERSNNDEHKKNKK